MTKNILLILEMKWWYFYLIDRLMERVDKHAKDFELLVHPYSVDALWMYQKKVTNFYFMEFDDASENITTLEKSNRKKLKKKFSQAILDLLAYY